MPVARAQSACRPALGLRPNPWPLNFASLPPLASQQVTGPALTLAGFPAWCVRTAEMYGIGPLAALTPGRLAAALRRYSATKQRFGK